MRIKKSLIFLNLISLIVFILIFVNVTLEKSLVKLDLKINSYLVPNNSLLLGISKIFHFMFDVKILLIASFLIALFLWIRDSKKDSVLFIGTGLIATGVIYILKELASRARPVSKVIAETGFSFPSGHSTIAVVFFGVLVYLIFNRSKNMGLKVSSIVISSLLVLLIGFTRLYLGVHWFSDVVGGFAVGIFILTSCVIVFERLK